MGDNIFLGDRDGVRTPMQWTPDRNAGFSTADFEQLYLPPIMDPVYGYQAVNVEAQRRNPGLVPALDPADDRRPQAATRSSPSGSYEPVPVSNPAVFVYVRGPCDDGAEPDPVRGEPVAAGPAGGGAAAAATTAATPVELLGKVEFPRDRRAHRTCSRCRPTASSGSSSADHGSAVGRRHGRSARVRVVGSGPMDVHDLPTPALLIDADALDANLATMAAARPGTGAAPPREGPQVHRAGPAAGRRRPPHVHAAPRRARWSAWPPPASATTCCWPTRALDPARLRGDGRRPGRRAVTVAVDSDATIDAAAAGRHRARCSSTSTSACPAAAAPPTTPARLADLARGRGPRRSAA